MHRSRDAPTEDDYGWLDEAERADHARLDNLDEILRHYTESARSLLEGLQTEAWAARRMLGNVVASKQVSLGMDSRAPRGTVTEANVSMHVLYWYLAGRFARYYSQDPAYADNVKAVLQAYVDSALGGGGGKRKRKGDDDALFELTERDIFPVLALGSDATVWKKRLLAVERAMEAEALAARSTLQDLRERYHGQDLGRENMDVYVLYSYLARRMRPEQRAPLKRQWDHFERHLRGGESVVERSATVRADIVALSMRVEKLKKHFLEWRRMARKVFRFITRAYKVLLRRSRRLAGLGALYLYLARWFKPVFARSIEESILARL